MKKELLFLSVAFAAMQLFGQLAVPNPDFELWTQNSIEQPTYLEYNSNEQCYRRGKPLNINKVTPAYHGQYALEIKSTSSEMGYMLNTDPKEGNMNSWTNGIAFTQMPTGIRGYYKYNVATADSALMLIYFRKNSTTIGSYSYKIGGIKTEFTLFDFNFSTPLTQTPDSLIFCLVASDFYRYENGLPGSTLIVDSISLKGLNTQPIELNGDFELWHNQLMPIKINDWNENNKEEEGLARSTDAYTGQYAVELNTHKGEENNLIVARPAFLTSGYWSETCNCMQGGMPYILTKDTLVFWYKYFPQGDDMGQVYLDFIKNNQQINYALVNLSASSTYKKAELPFEIGMAPDHVIINAISTLWQNTNLSYVGSRLLIDKMYFKSSINVSQLPTLNELKPLSIHNQGDKSLIILHSENQKMKILITDISGKQVYTNYTTTNSVDISAFKAGIYLVRIEFENRIYNLKFIKR